MQRRNPERRGPSTARLSALACLTALVVSTVMVFSSPANAGAKSPSGVAGGADKHCSKVDPKHPVSDCPTGTAGGAMAAVDASSLAEQLLSQVAKTAGTKIGGQIAGWALDSIFGPSPDPTQELKDQIDVLQGQMTNLQKEVKQLDTKLDDSIKKLMTQADQNAYDVAATQVNSDAAQLADYQVQLDSWLRESPGTPVDGSQSAELQTMRSTLGVILQHLDRAMVGAPGSRGLIEMYRSVVQNTTPYPTTRFYTSDFTTPMSDMLDYYQSLAVQAFNMLAEVNHLSWTLNGTTFAANNSVVESYATKVPTMLAHWNELGTGGVGRLPNGVVADTTTGLMWTRTGLVFGGNQYFCWAYCGDKLSISTLFDVNSVLDGVTGWAIPTQAQFTGLVQGQSASFRYLSANGFQWQQGGLKVNVNNLPITAPAYWSAGITTVQWFENTFYAKDQNGWPVFLPGPGAVAVRSMG
jgi:hypothetical protein